MVLWVSLLPHSKKGFESSLDLPVLAHVLVMYAGANVSVIFVRPATDWRFIQGVGDRLRHSGDLGLEKRNLDK